MSLLSSLRRILPSSSDSQASVSRSTQPMVATASSAALKMPSASMVKPSSMRMSVAMPSASPRYAQKSTPRNILTSAVSMEALSIEHSLSTSSTTVKASSSLDLPPPSYSFDA